MEKGKVVKSTGMWYHVEIEDHSIISCRIIGKFRLNGQKLTNPVAVGDEVEFEMEQDGKGIIKKILPRKNYVVRQSPRKKHYLHLLASNVDQAILIMTIRNPNLKQGFIDRFLLMTEPYNIPTTIVFNKADLLEEDDLLMFEYLKDIYEDIGYPVFKVSAIEGEGIEKLREHLANKISLIGGQSGVGKSTLINAVLPGIDLRTDDISDYTGKGQHTTTFAEMFQLPGGGQIIDTPGIKTLAFSHLEPKDITHNFREIFVASEHCKFSNCSHRNEPKCAVKEGVEEGTISELRYANYLQLMDDTEGQNYWERHKDM